MLAENCLRSLAKTISWRICGAVLTFVTVYILSESVPLASSVTLFRELASTVLYYLHERLWNKISWGRRINS